MGTAMDEITQTLGNFGRYQGFILVVVFLPGFMVGLLSLSFSWTGYTPNVRCALPGENLQNTTYGWPFSTDQLRNRWYPPSRDANEERALCTYCPFGYDNYTCDSSNAKKCNHGIVYDTSVFRTSLIIKYEMACEGSYKKELVRVWYMLGIFFGALISGHLSDRYGRRPSFLFFALTQIIFLNVEFLIIELGYVPTLIVHFFNGMLGDAAYLTAYVLLLEALGGYPKTFFGVWYQATFTMGALAAALVAYFERDWKTMQIIYGIPSLFYLMYFWLFPESIRWALTNHKTEEAKKLITRASKWNKVLISEKLIVEAASETKTDFENASILNMFRNGWYLIKTALLIGVSWLATSMSYYGLTYNTQDLPGDVFVSYVLSAASELPGFVICVPMMEKFGRRTTMVTMLGFGGLSCICAGLTVKFFPDREGSKTAVLALGMIGKMCAAAAYAVIYNYTVEIFPTVVRSSGTSFGSSCARIGSISAPLLHNLVRFYRLRKYHVFLINGYASLVS